MVNAEKQTRNTYKYFIQAGVSAVLALITLPVYTRLITPEEFGYIALAQVYALLMIGIANFGIVEVLERNYFQYKDDPVTQGKLLFTCLMFVGTFSIALIAITWMVLNPVANIMGVKEAPMYVLLALVGQAIANINNYFYIYLKNGADAGAYSKYNIVVAILNAFVGVYLIAFLHTDAVGILYALIVSSIVGFLLLFTVFIQKYQFAIDFRILSETLKLAYPMTPRILTGVLSNQLDKYLVGMLSSVGMVGIYSIGQRVSYYVFYFMTILQNVFGPEVYRRMFTGESGKKHGNGIYLSIFLYISVLFALVVVLFSREITGVLLGSAYSDSAQVIAILATFYAIQFPGKITGKQIVYARKTGLISVLSVVTLTISVLVMIPLVMKWGALGAAWGALFTGIVSNTIAFLVAQKYHNIDWELGRMSIIYSLLGIALMISVMSTGEGGAVLSVVLLKIALLAAYLVYGTIIGVVTRKGIKLLMQSARQGAVSA